MSWRTLCLVAFVTCVFAVSYAHAEDWHVVYPTNDFSSDPNWDTNDTNRFYWDEPNQVYVAHQVNVDNGGYYAVHPVGHGGHTFRLTWDINVKSIDSSANVAFGMFDSDKRTEPDGSNAFVVFTKGGSSSYIRLDTTSSTGVHQFTVLSPNPAFDPNTWYHVEMQYLGAAGTLEARVTTGDPEQEVCVLSLSNVGHFAEDMEYLGTSNVRDGTFQVPGAEAWAEIDNVSYEIPEPATLSLLALGTVALIRRRRRA